MSALWFNAPWACGHADSVYICRDSQECAICHAIRYAPGSWREIDARLATLDERMWTRANGYAARAGLGIERNVWSNAMLARDAGAPWVVDYDALREAITIDERRLLLGRKRSAMWRAYERARLAV